MEKEIIKKNLNNNTYTKYEDLIEKGIKKEYIKSLFDSIEEGKKYFKN